MNIILGICGSIAAYKSIDLARLLVKNGHRVKVILTKGSLEFLNPKVFSYLGVESVYGPYDDFNYPKESTDNGTVLHVELSKWADKIVIAPLSANTLANFCQGCANDLLSSLFLASQNKTPWLFFPAMNTQMLNHPFVQRNLQDLSSLERNFVHPTDSGELACGDHGKGKLPSIETIFNVVECFHPYPVNRHILITTGATLAPLDPVRYLTNSSSGLTGLHLAKYALSKGFKVTVIAGIFASPELDSLARIPQFTLERVSTTSSMKEAVHKYFKSCDIYISSAAICDIDFTICDSKIKKSSLTNSLPITMAPDILASVLKIKEDHQKVVGFAAETNLSLEIMKKKLKNKPVDLLVGTFVNSGLSDENERSGFANDFAHYCIMKNENSYNNIKLNKTDLPNEIFERLQLQ